MLRSLSRREKRGKGTVFRRVTPRTVREVSNGGTVSLPASAYPAIARAMGCPADGTAYLSREETTDYRSPAESLIVSVENSFRVRKVFLRLCHQSRVTPVQSMCRGEYYLEHGMAWYWLRGSQEDVTRLVSLCRHIKHAIRHRPSVSSGTNSLHPMDAAVRAKYASFQRAKVRACIGKEQPGHHPLLRGFKPRKR